MAPFSLDDLNFESKTYEPWAAYAQSKTANILFAVELDRRLEERGIRATALHPGGIQTELGRHLDPGMIEGMLAQINAALAAEGKSGFEWKTIPQGAATSVWAGFVAPADAIGGKYCENCHVSHVTDAEISPISEGVRSYALDPEMAKALWARSEEMVGERF